MRRFQLQMIDGKELINFEWTCNQPPRAIIQIVHNIDEYMGIYDNVAKMFNKHNLLVVGTDLRGLGESSLENNEFGVFAKHQGFNTVIEDLRTVNTFIKRKYPDTPIFMLGQTIGADFALAYAIKYSETLNGLVLLGTKFHNCWLAHLKLIAIRCINIFTHKWTNQVFFHHLDKYFATPEHQHTKNRWMSSDMAFVEMLNQDHLAQTWMSNVACKDILQSQIFVSKKHVLNLIDKDFPMVLMNGDQDAYAQFTKSIRKLFAKLIKLGNNVNLITYNGLRNRILNDHGREKVVDDIIAFINNNVD